VNPYACLLHLQSCSVVPAPVRVRPMFRTRSIAALGVLMLLPNVSSFAKVAPSSVQAQRVVGHSLRAMGQVSQGPGPLSKCPRVCILINTWMGCCCCVCVRVCVCVCVCFFFCKGPGVERATSASSSIHLNKSKLCGVPDMNVCQVQTHVLRCWSHLLE
jgi:hypothetical protein